MIKRNNANWYIILSLVLTYVSSIFLSSLMVTTSEEELFKNVTNFLNSLVINGIPILIFALLNKNRFRENFRKIPGKTLGVSILATPVVWSCGNYINSQIINFTSRFDILPVQQLPQSDEPVVIFWGFVFACLVAPFMEELFYRGIILRLLQGYGKGCAMIVSAVLFAFAHNSITVFGLPLVYGLVFGYVTLKSGSIWTAVVMHFGANVLSWSIMSFEPGGMIMAVINIIIIVLGGVGVVWALLRIIKEKDKIKSTLSGLWSYMKNPLWVLILANYIFINLAYHG